MGKTVHLRRYPFLRRSAFILGCLAFLLVLFRGAWAQTNTANAAASAATASPSPTPSDDDLTISPEEEIQVLEAVDSTENAQSTPAAVTASQGAPSANHSPPTIPTNLKTVLMKDGVYLSWDASAANSSVAAYNVYRSTTPGAGYRQVNLKPLTTPYFLDGPLNSYLPPQNGEDYFYVVCAVNSAGDISPYSEEAPAEPTGMEFAEAIPARATPTPPPKKEDEVLKVPEGAINLQLPADTSLSIQGYKKIDAQLSFQSFDRVNGLNGLPSQVDTTAVNQELVVNLQGKVGKNVDVNVDYSDVNRAGGVDQSKQDISIVYHGDTDSAVQEVAFGNLNISLPNTEFAGFNKQLFGLEAVMKLENFKFLAFFAQTQGITATKIFNGNSVQQDKTYQDINFIPYKYFLITRTPSTLLPTAGLNPVTDNALPKPNSEQIWIDMGNGVINPSGPNYGPPPTNNFRHMAAGVEYTIDYTTGIITFLTSIPNTARLAVGYMTNDGHWVGNVPGGPATVNLTSGLTVPPDGVLYWPPGSTMPSYDAASFPPGGTAAHLIKDNTNDVTPGAAYQNVIALSPNYLVNYFDLGKDKIVPPTQDPAFQFQVLTSSSSVLQTGQAVTTTYPSNEPWIYNLNLDFNYLTVSDYNYVSTVAPSAATSFLFPERPFANQDATGGSGTNDVYSQTTTPISVYSVHLHYKTSLSSYNLNQFNIIRGSEAVYLDGRRLRRDTDYFIDYTSGFLDFQDKSILSPSSQVVVTYEYAPFGNFSQDDIIGARAEYSIADNFILGSTFLMSDAQQPIDTPQIGSTPNQVMVLDADAQYTMDQDEVRSFTDAIPGLEHWKPPVTIKLSGEVAQSYYDPDTFDAEGETGVAMVDNMEGIDSVLGPSMSSTSWLVSSAPETPQNIPGFGGVVYQAGPTVTNNRVRFFNDTPNYGNAVTNATMADFEVIGTQSSAVSQWNGQQFFPACPAYGGHIYANTQQGNDAISVLQFPYSHLTNQSWAGVRQVLSAAGMDFSNVAYFESYVYNDGKPKWVMVDFGIMSEDSNGNGVLDQDPAAAAATVTADNNYGIPTFYMPNTPWYINPSPGNPNPPAGNGIFLQDNATPANWGYIAENSSVSGVTELSQEGYGIGSGTNFITEDMNGDHILESGESADAYYEFGFLANWTGWKQVKLPFNSTTPVTPTGLTSTPDGTTYFFTSSVNAPEPQVIRTVRLWVTGASPSPISGDFWMENLSFSRNLWQLEVDPTAVANNAGVTINTTKFDVASISQDQNPSYNPTIRFLTVEAGQDEAAILYKEKSLDITYNLSSADVYDVPNTNIELPIYYCTRIFNQGMDFTDYQNLRIDLTIKSYRPGDVLFVRVGNDPEDYYQYNIQLSMAATTCMNQWGTVIIPLDGSGGNRTTVGTPFINHATQISFGVVSPNGPSGTTGNLWIDNLRATDPVNRSGVARRLDAAFILGDDPNKPFATVNTRYREVDSGFTQIDQTSNHFQHSTELGADFTSPKGIMLFGQPLATQFSYTHENLYTEAALATDPYFITLPNVLTDNYTGTMSYTKDLGAGWGRLTSVRLSGTYTDEKDSYEQVYLEMPGVQGDTQKTDENFTLASTYDAPTKFFSIPIGANQFNESFTLDHATENFDEYTLFDSYNRTTRTQSYSWTNTTELMKNLVFTPGYTVSLTDAFGNTLTPGVFGAPVTGYTPFLQSYQPKAGLVYRGITGIIPSVSYTGSNQLDYVSFPDGTRFSNANSLNTSVNLTPGSWVPLLQKMNLTIFAGQTQSTSESIPGYGPDTGLSFLEQWGLTKPSGDAILATDSTTDQLNASFKLFDVWDFRPTGSWTNQANLLSYGTNPVQQTGDTLGLTTVYNKKLLTLPFLNVSIDSAQIQYTHTESIQYDSDYSGQTNDISQYITSDTKSDLYSLTLPYDINKKASGNIRLQSTQGYQNGLSTSSVPVYQRDDLASVEYDQKFAPNLELKIPFTRWRIKLQDAIEFQAIAQYEVVNNTSNYAYNEKHTQSYKGTVNLNYNALKNLRVGIGVVYQDYWDYITNTNGYQLWQFDASAEARF